MLKNSGVMPISISDHDLVYLNLNFKKRRPKPVYIMRRSYKHYDGSAFARDVSEDPWSVVDSLDDVEEN